MRVLVLLMLLVGHALVCAPAFAETPKPEAAKPEFADEVDIVRVQLLEARVELAQRELERVRVALTLKYRLERGDEIDFKTLVVRRAPKPMAPEFKPNPNQKK